MCGRQYTIKSQTKQSPKTNKATFICSIHATFMRETKRKQGMTLVVAEIQVEAGPVWVQQLKKRNGGVEEEGSNTQANPKRNKKMKRKAMGERVVFLVCFFFFFFFFFFFLLLSK